jgi:ribosomal protein L11 methyltransferase
VPLDEAEQARARLLELVPEGFEEVEREGVLELAAYVDELREGRVRSAFADAHADDVTPGWEERWRTFHRPIQIGPLWIGPPWERPAKGLLAVVIDPGRAFGTGAHPTTRLCVELLLDVPRGSLLDLGCGSGVLAIAAARLGFAPVRALDVEEQAVEAARRNAELNGVAVAVERTDVRDYAPAATEVAVMNIAPDVIAAAAAKLRARFVVTSGYLDIDAVELPGYRLLERREHSGWAADLHERE